jgi:single-strand DNA-binding protein
MDVNKVILLGRLTKDPIAKNLPSGQEISQFTVATNYQWKDFKTKKSKENVEFHPVIVWGKLANVANTYLTKGAKVYLEGKLRTRSWEDKSRQKHFRTEIVAHEMNMLGSKGKQSAKQNNLVVEDITVEEVPIDNN